MRRIVRRASGLGWPRMAPGTMRSVCRISTRRSSTSTSEPADADRLCRRDRRLLRARRAARGSARAPRDQSALPPASRALAAEPARRPLPGGRSGVRRGGGTCAASRCAVPRRRCATSSRRCSRRRCPDRPLWEIPPHRRPAGAPQRAAARCPPLMIEQASARSACSSASPIRGGVRRRATRGRRRRCEACEARRTWCRCPGARPRPRAEPDNLFAAMRELYAVDAVASSVCATAVPRTARARTPHDLALVPVRRVGSAARRRRLHDRRRRADRAVGRAAHVYRRGRRLPTTRRSDCWSP